MDFVGVGVFDCVGLISVGSVCVSVSVSYCVGLISGGSVCVFVCI